MSIFKSPKFSFEGFSIKKLLIKNKLWFIQNAAAIKSLISGTGAMIAAAYPTSPIVKLLFGVGGAYATYLITSAFQYWISEVNL